MADPTRQTSSRRLTVHARRPPGEPITDRAWTATADACDGHRDAGDDDDRVDGVTTGSGRAPARCNHDATRRRPSVAAGVQARVGHQRDGVHRSQIGRVFGPAGDRAGRSTCCSADAAARHVDGPHQRGGHRRGGRRDRRATATGPSLFFCFGFVNVFVGLAEPACRCRRSTAGTSRCCRSRRSAEAGDRHAQADPGHGGGAGVLRLVRGRHDDLGRHETAPNVP